MAIVLGVTSPPVTALTPVPTPAPIPAPVATVLPSSCAARFAPNSWNNVLPACTNCFAPTVPITTEGAYSPTVAAVGANSLALATLGVNFCRPASASSPPAIAPPTPPAIAPTGPPTANPPNPPAIPPITEADPLTNPAAPAATFTLVGTSTACVFTKSSISTSCSGV